MWTQFSAFFSVKKSLNALRFRTRINILQILFKIQKVNFFVVINFVLNKQENRRVKEKGLYIVNGN